MVKITKTDGTDSKAWITFCIEGKPHYNGHGFSNEELCMLIEAGATDGKQVDGYIVEPM